MPAIANARCRRSLKAFDDGHVGLLGQRGRRVSVGLADAGDQHGGLGKVARAFGAGDDERAGSVGFQRAVVQPERGGDHPASSDGLPASAACRTSALAGSGSRAPGRRRRRARAARSSCRTRACDASRPARTIAQQPHFRREARTGSRRRPPARPRSVRSRSARRSSRGARPARSTHDAMPAAMARHALWIDAIRLAPPMCTVVLNFRSRSPRLSAKSSAQRPAVALGITPSTSAVLSPASASARLDASRCSSRVVRSVPRV